MQIIWEEPVN